MNDILNLDEIKKLHNSTLNIIAGRPNMGKSSLAFNIAINVAQKEKVPVAIFSLEMSREYICNNFIDSVLLNTYFFIDDTPNIAITEIQEKCRNLKVEKNIGLVVIDYLQLISTDEVTSQKKNLSNIGLILKKLAEELDITVLITIQLSSEPERRYCRI